MSSDETRLSPSARKAARNATRQALRARKLELVDAFRADWEDRDPDTSNLLDAALAADGESKMTSWLLFGLASRAISELSDATGTSREQWLSDLLK
jgi:hypothetical protein